MFQELVNDIGHHVALNGEFSIDFANDGVFLLIFVRFWWGDHLCRVFLKRTRRTQGQAQAEINLISYVMGVLSTGPCVVSVTGCTAAIVQLLDGSPYSDLAVQSPPRFEELQLQSLMHKKSSSVFVRIDFFSVLRFLVVSLGAGLELDWLLLSPELSKVMITSIQSW